jgi:hypothetical protein
MPTNTPGSAARAYYHSQTHYLVSRPITLADLNGAQIFMGILPAGAVVVRAGAVVPAAFNYGTNNRFNLGTTGTPNLIASNVSLAAAAVAAGTVNMPNGGVMAADAPIYATLDLTGTAASAGSATAFVEYFVPQGPS